MLGTKDDGMIILSELFTNNPSPLNLNSPNNAADLAFSGNKFK